MSNQAAFPLTPCYLRRRQSDGMSQNGNENDFKLDDVDTAALLNFLENDSKLDNVDTDALLKILQDYNSKFACVLKDCGSAVQAASQAGTLAVEAVGAEYDALKKKYVALQVENAALKEECAASQAALLRCDKHCGAKSAGADERSLRSGAKQARDTAVPAAQVKRISEVPKNFIRVKVLKGPDVDMDHKTVKPYLQTAKKKRCVIGRVLPTSRTGIQNSVLLDKDKFVSKTHGYLWRIGEDFYYENRSQNGTRDVKTEALLPEEELVQLQNGTQLQLGDSILEFTFEK